MHPQLLGIHHVTAIVDDPQENVDFYTRALGLRLVKQTVNFDDPYTYHLYYGDEHGRPGTIVTFFPWPAGRRGSRGSGQISAFSFVVPPGALAFWQGQLDALGWRFGGPAERAGAQVLSFYDPAGLLIELVERPVERRGAGTALAGIPPEAAIARLYGVTLTVAQLEPSARFLSEALGFRPAGADAGQAHYVLGEGDDAAVVSLIPRPDLPRGQVAVGSTHHVAWRVADEAALARWQHDLAQRVASVTPVRDRHYFRSVYFREPGGVLFELATDPPGFAIDEQPASLGARLRLPPWLEPQRDMITRRLPPVTFPAAPAERPAWPENP